MSIDKNERPLESGVHTDLAGRLTYGGYLQLDTLLSAQKPLSDPPQHDELLFITQHQVSELWMKLMIHELRAAVELLRADDVGGCQKVFARVKAILRQLTDMWTVLETLTPADYMKFRDILGPSSGFQSLQYRAIEFLLGNKNAQMLRVFEHDPAAHALLDGLLHAPSLYDEALRFLSRHGHAVPGHLLERDWSATRGSDPGLLPALERIYEDSTTHWAAYQLCEDLVDLETQFQLWRFRHMRTVMRIIGFKRGTGGSSGVGFLKQALELSFFPELFEVRTRIGLAVAP